MIDRKAKGIGEMSGKWCWLYRFWIFFTVLLKLSKYRLPKVP